jgi:5'-nucleotidase
MKKIFLFFLFIQVITGISAQQERKIIILHTNDLHSRINGFSPESEYTPFETGNDKTKGGFARIAAILKDEKEKNQGITLTVDAGDFLMGTLFHSLEVKTGFQLRLMKKMGYDMVCLGNHEFDFGPEKLAAIINRSAEKGEIPAILLGNAVFNDKDPGDDAFEKLYASNTITRKLIISRDGLKIGVFALLGIDAADVAPLAKPVKFSKQISFARNMVKELQEEKCDIIICISHSGISKDKKGIWTGEDVKLAKSVKGIDLIIGGHSHTRLEQPLPVNGTPIVQTGEFGQNVGRISLTYSDGKVKVDGYKLIPVDDRIMGDENVNKLIEEQKERINTEILIPLGMEYARKVVEAGFIIEGNDLGDYVNSNLGPLIADAIHYYINKNSVKGADVSMVAAGMIFDKILPGVQTAPDIFRVMPLGSGKDNVPGYALSRLYVTGKEMKTILEILLVAGKSDPQKYCYYSGLRVEYNPDKGLLKKIKKIEILNSDGSAKNVDFSKKNKSLYSVTADSYMLEFIGIIKKMSFGLINVIPKDSAGNRVTDMQTAVIDMDENKAGVQEGKEWLALMEYLASMKDTDGNGIPDIDKKHSVPVRTFFTVKK